MGAFVNKIVVDFLQALFKWLGDYGVTVIIFTLTLKLVMLPFDFWQKRIARRNAAAQKRLKPKLEALRAQCGDDQQGQMKYYQMSRELNKKEGYNALGACLPAILTMVIFISVFGGFNAYVQQRNAALFVELQDAYYLEYIPAFDAHKKLLTDGYDGFYNEEYAKIYEAEIEGGSSPEAAAEKAETDAKKIMDNRLANEPGEVAKSSAEAAVSTVYDAKKDGFLWIKNIFMADTPWTQEVPDMNKFTGLLGRPKASDPSIELADRGPEKYGSHAALTLKDEYNKITASLRTEAGNDKLFGWQWNGLLILPILAVLLNFFSMKLAPQQAQAAPPPTMGGGGGMSAEEREKQMQSQQKMMMYMMPIMFGFFALTYSSAFTLYMLISAMFSVAFNLIYNFFAKKKDTIVEETVAATTYMTKREYEAMKSKEAEESAKAAENKKKKGGGLFKQEDTAPKADDINFQKVRLNLPNDKKPAAAKPIKTYEPAHQPTPTAQNKPAGNNSKQGNKKK